MCGFDVRNALEKTLGALAACILVLALAALVNLAGGPQLHAADHRCTEYSPCVIPYGSIQWNSETQALRLIGKLHKLELNLKDVIALGVAENWEVDIGINSSLLPIPPEDFSGRFNVNFQVQRRLQNERPFLPEVTMYASVDAPELEFGTKMSKLDLEHDEKFATGLKIGKTFGRFRVNSSVGPIILMDPPEEAYRTGYRANVTTDYLWSDQMLFNLGFTAESPFFKGWSNAYTVTGGTAIQISPATALQVNVGHTFSTGTNENAGESFLMIRFMREFR